MLKEGDWVYYAGPNIFLEGALGYISKKANGKYRVKFIRYDTGERANRITWMKDKHLLPATVRPLDKQSFDVLMDVALYLRDYEWCKELVNKYKGVIV